MKLSLKFKTALQNFAKAWNLRRTKVVALARFEPGSLASTGSFKLKSLRVLIDPSSTPLTAFR